MSRGVKVKIFYSLFILSLCLSCQKSNSLAPDTLDGKTLRGQVTSSSGLFSGMTGYNFSTQFLNEIQYQTRDNTGKIDSQGPYQYSKTSSRLAKLILTDSASLHKGVKIEITLKFTSSNGGTYDAKTLKGQTGEQSGLFNL